MKMMKTAIVTASVLASASIFAQSAGVNAGASAQVNVQPGGLVSGVANTVKNIVKLLYYSYKIRKTRNNSSTESINHSLRLRLTHAHICSIGFKSGLYAGSQRILCPCCSNNS